MIFRTGSTMRRFLDHFDEGRSLGWFFFAFILGSAGYMVCQTSHFCMGGHNAHPEEVSETFLARCVDAFWISAFVLSMLLIFKSGITFRYVFVFSIGMVLLFFCGYDLIGIPLHSLLAVIAIAFRAGWID